MMAPEREEHQSEMPRMTRSTTGGGFELFDSGKDVQVLEGSKAERRWVAMRYLVNVVMLTSSLQVPGVEPPWYSGLLSTE